LSRLKLSKTMPISKSLYKFCKEYVDRYNGENNDAIQKNGELTFLRKHAERCSVIFDVGANKGEWTKLAFSFNPKATIHCFEPIKRLYKELLTNNFTTNIICNNIGISEKPDRKLIYLDTQSVYNREGIKPAGKRTIFNGDTEEITLTTIDAYCKEHTINQIDFLKIDIEGHEFSALKGARSMLDSEKILRIQFEYGGCYIDARTLLKDIFELFSDRNYTFYKIMPHKLDPVPAYLQKLENFQYKNIAILHNSIAANH
jgi:FkbM family methyltransferase